MSNLKFARAVIKAELEHAKQGLDYYKSRVQTLEGALHQVDALSGTGKEAVKQRKSGKSIEALSAKHDRSALPKTGVDFWLQYITKRPRSAVDIANAAAAALKLDTENDKDLIRVLKQRVSPGLESLVKAKKIHSTGAGRERRFIAK